MMNGFYNNRGRRGLPQFAGYTTPGLRPGPNQDAYWIRETEFGSDAVAVFDGHGRDGHRASQLAVDYFDRTYPQHRDLPYDFDDDFHQISHRINQHFDGGTTATAVEIEDHGNWRIISCSNVGDSPALLIDPYSTGHDRPDVIPLATMHDTTNRDEVKRMRQLDVDVGRTYFGSIAVSRALGDGHHRGVLPVPAVSGYESRRERVLVVGSDGVLNPDTIPEVVEAVRDMHHYRDLGAVACETAMISIPRTKDNGTVVIGKLPAVGSW